MKTIKYQNIITVFIALLIAYYWCNGVTPETEKTQFFLTGISLLLFTASIIFRTKLKAKFEWVDPFLSIITISTVFLLTFYIWNDIFQWYSHNNDYRGNIFRGAFDGFRAPFYGHLVSKNLSNYIPALISSALFLIFAFAWRKKWHNLKYNSILISLIGLLILSFSWHQSLEQTFLSANCHYETFASDLSQFGSIKDVLREFTQKSSTLGIHNNHYPPGNLLLLKIEEAYWPYLSKSSVFIAVLLALFPLNKLMELWNFNKSEKLIAFILYGTSGAILFYPGVAMTPLMLPFSIAAIYLMMKFFQKGAIIYSIAFALIMAGYTFFTFTALVFLLFSAIVLIFKVILKEISIKQLIVFGLISSISYLIFFFLLFISTSFNMLDCFITSVSSEKVQMDYSGIESWPRYFIVSTGNILAYIGVIGIPVIGIIFHGFRNRNNTIPKHLKSLTYGLVTTVILIGFSNQFFLEVERIWIFLSPFFLLISGWLLAQFYNDEKYNFVFSIILMLVVTSLSLSVSIDHCY